VRNITEGHDATLDGKGSSALTVGPLTSVITAARDVLPRDAKNQYMQSVSYCSRDRLVDNKKRVGPANQSTPIYNRNSLLFFVQRLT
jgi:hypothetical protein